MITIEIMREEFKRLGKAYTEYYSDFYQGIVLSEDGEDYPVFFVFDTVGILKHFGASDM